MRLKPGLRKIPGYRIARFVWQLARGAESRHAALILLRPPKALYQPYGTTSSDRYPDIFRYVREAIEDGPNLRILSFGCATGEEVFTLRCYFPQAVITGIDINPLNIAVCRFRRMRIGDRQMSFAVAGSAAAEADASYDVVFAMAVFRHGDLNTSPPPRQSSHRIRFADFEESTADLARILRPNGLLVIQNAMFRFADTRASRGFKAELRVKRDQLAPLYGCDDRLLLDAEACDVVFRKIR